MSARAYDFMTRVIPANRSEHSEDEPAKPRPTRDEVRNAAEEFRASQPSEVVPLRPAEPSMRGMTLRAAYDLIVEHDGFVEPGPFGTLTFRLPRLFAEGASGLTLKRKVLLACELLDACRPVVHDALTNGEELPDLPGALGGGVVE